MPDSSDVIFLTGGSGFLGSHILIQLLNQGYHVRAAVREKKAALFKQGYERFKDQLEVVAIADIATDQFPDALRGVKAVIHTAAPIAGRVNDAESQLKGSVEGLLNVIRQAEKARITRIIVTSTVLTAATPAMTFTDKDWYPATKEAALKSTGIEAYHAAKTLAEREVWNFADAHPDVEITTLNPPFLYGPFAEGFSLPNPDYYALSTNLYIYKFLTPEGTFPSYPLYIDVRDAAKAHLLALNSPPTSEVGRKRVILSSPHEVVFADIVSMINAQRPELDDRLIKTAPPEFPFKRLDFDLKRLQQVLGMKVEDFTPLNDTFLDTVDSLLVQEKQWTAAGFVVKVPT
ncbi:hypothetical protein J3R30DRAFT_139996 [Lentinula aciculospora]|uniref:NAD-dependent epimerase/dehydratase domain-containing protein n=1 Tax=Lentinula aciculospora TaxID=153920 RepID=A0A9W9DX93_9AGAR|nr:hypothetical protein J3R30DRAFT_139996 [Lentinula aciculospora]